MPVSLPALPPHPNVFVTNPATLGAYLQLRGVDYTMQPYGLSIAVDLGGPADFVVDVHWLSDQVRFIAPSLAKVSAVNLAEASLFVEKMNAEIGFPVWRVIPTVAAVYTATLDHNGELSSRVIEYAVALLRDALVRDQPALRAHLGDALA